MKTKFQVKQWTRTAFRFVEWIGVTDPFRRGMLERTRTPSGSSFFNNYYFFHYEICCRLDERTMKRYPQTFRTLFASEEGRYYVVRLKRGREKAPEEAVG